MSRPLRLEYEGAVWHVTSRGNERRPVFRDDSDREAFLTILGRTVGLFRWRLHAYVLMRNHFHLLLETPEPTLSRGMRQLNGHYTQRFNRRHRRAGHLFQGRFKAILVEKESHLLELCRYVVLNPVRARATRSAREWAWSGYRATAGLAPAPRWLETDWTLKQFGARKREAQEAYRRFVAEGRAASYEPWAEVRGQIYLGTTEFLEEMERRAEEQDTRETPRPQRRPRPRTLSEILKEATGRLGVRIDELNRHPRLHVRERKLLAHVLRDRGLLRLEEIGETLGVKAAQASALVRGGGELIVSKDRLARRLRAGEELK
jgi:REP element-mobilizing transposase RayT